MKVKFKQWDCIAVPGQYKNAVKAIQLIDENDGDLVATATVNIHNEMPQHKNNVFIKNYSENEGMIEALITAGIIESKKMNSYPSGYVIICEHKLTEKGLSLFKTKNHD